jgi:hypothetical protein
VPIAIRTSWFFAAVLLTLLVLGVLKLAGRAQVEVLAPKTSDLTVTVDADQPIVVRAGTHQTVAVPKGTHLVTLHTIEGTSTLSFEIEGGLDWFVASGPNQCLALIDIAGSHYAPEGKTPNGRPTITSTMRAATTRRAHGNLFFSSDRAPPTVKNQRADITLVREVRCELLDAPEDQLLNAIPL